MNALESEIVDMYDTDDMSVSAICEELNSEIDPTAIKMILSTHSRRFQKETVEEAKRMSGKIPTDTKEKPANFNLISAVEQKQIMQTLITLMNQSDNDMVRARAAIYLNEELTGRNEKRVKNHAVPDMHMNIRALNEQILRARELMAVKMGMIGTSPMLRVVEYTPAQSDGSSTRVAGTKAPVVMEAEVVA